MLRKTAWTYAFYLYNSSFGLGYIWFFCFHSLRGLGLAVKLMVRGIYSTALVKLALASGGFEIVSPTE